MDTITSLLRVTGLMFAAAGLVGTVLVLPWARADRGRLEKATDASVHARAGTSPTALSWSSTRACLPTAWP